MSIIHEDARKWKNHHGSVFAMEFSVQDKDPDHLPCDFLWDYLTFLLVNSKLPSYPSPLRNLELSGSWRWIGFHQCFWVNPHPSCQKFHTQPWDQSDGAMLTSMSSTFRALSQMFGTQSEYLWGVFVVLATKYRSRIWSKTEPWENAAKERWWWTIRSWFDLLWAIFATSSYDHNCWT